jgi:hypothetical protein
MGRGAGNGAAGVDVTMRGAAQYTSEYDPMPYGGGRRGRLGN